MALTIEQREKIRKLSEYRYLMQEIDRLLRRLQSLEDRKYRLGGIISDTGGGGGGRDTDPILTCIAEFEGACIDLKAQIKDMREKGAVIYNAISSVKDADLRDVLMRRYIEGHRPEKIMVDEHLSRTTYYRWHEKALDSVEI